MTKSTKARVLVVEDDLDIRDSFARYLRSNGYIVDEADGLAMAIQRIADVTYHVAVVDIMLAGPDRKNRDGLRVADEINRIGEGTLSIIVSQQEDTQVAADTLQNQGVYRYLSKVSIEQQGLEVLLSAVASAMSKVELTAFGSGPDTSGKVNFLSCLDYIAGSGPQMIVNFNKWTSLFKPQVSPRLLEDTLDSFISLWAPILPMKSASELISFHPVPPCLVGTFWSKVLGEPVTLVICQPGTLEEGRVGQVLPELKVAPEIESARQIQKKILATAAFLRRDLKRSDFEERMRPASLGGISGRVT